MELCAIEWLPEPSVVMNRSRAAAAAEALLSAEPELRQYWCQDAWKPGITVAHHDDGAGSHSYIVQSGGVTVIKVCTSHRSLGPDSLCRFQRAPTVEMPALAVEVINEPEFRNQEMSFLAWSKDGSPWQGLSFRVDGISSLDMGQALLKVVCGGAKSFYVHAQSYHEVTIDPPSLMELFKLKPLDAALAAKIAPKADLSKALGEMKNIGYPVG